MLMGVGSTLYFSLDKEPPYAPAIIVLLGAFFCRQKLKKQFLVSVQPFAFAHVIMMWLLLISNLAIAFSLGFIAAKVRTSCIHIPKIKCVESSVSSEPAEIEPFGHPARPHEICSGIVESVEDVPRGTLKAPRQLRRCVIVTPGGAKIRVQAPPKKLKDIKIFDEVVLEAEIFTPPTRLTKHGYDAQFDAYFKELSAFGKVHKVISVNASNTPKPLIRQVRDRISNILRARLPASVSPLATALITGDKSGMTVQMRENFTRSGLSHMLAISGLHMGLLAWLVFSVLGRILLLIPRIGTRFLVKKIAAACVIPLLFGYLVLSGMSFSALRAFIMVTLSMLAIMLDQRAISLRNTAIAACIILLIFPESVYSVSFQLSFASVTGLCCVFSASSKKRVSVSISKIWGFIQRNLITPIQQSMVTTLVATLATTPIIIYVFQRVTLVGVLGNLVAVPFLSFCVMPFVAILIVAPISIVFSMFGKSLIVLAYMAETVANLPWSNFFLPKPSLTSVLLIIFSSLWFVIWHGRKRFLLAPSFIAGWLLMLFPNNPDIFLTRDLIGVREADTFYISSLRYGSFHGKVWSQECGVQDVQPMKYSDISKWQNALEGFIPASENDVVFLWRSRHLRAETFIPAKAERPWRKFL